MTKIITPLERHKFTIEICIQWKISQYDNESGPVNSNAIQLSKFGSNVIQRVNKKVGKKSGIVRAEICMTSTQPKDEKDEEESFVAEFQQTESERGRNSNDFLSEKPLWGWDYAFVFDTTELEDEEGEEETKLKKKLDRIGIIARLKRAGFVFSQIKSEEDNIIIIRFTLPNETMKEKAEKISLDVQLRKRYGGGHMDYKMEYSECFVNHRREKQTGSYFSPSDRIIIILNTLQSKEDWGCALNIEKLIYEDVMKQAFAIHSPKFQQELVQRAVWERPIDPFWVPPFREIKDYLGPRVGFYFAFVSLLTKYLLPMALLAIVLYIPKAVFARYVRVEDTLSWIFSISTVLWASYFLEMLKRRSAELVLDWGMLNYYRDTADEVRAQFRGVLKHGFYSSGGFVSLTDLAIAADDDEDDDEADGIPGGNRAKIEYEKSVHREMHADSGAVTTEELPINADEDRRASRLQRIISVGITALFIGLVASLTFLLLWYRNEIICGAQGLNREECKCYFSVSCPKEQLEGLNSYISGLAKALPGILNGVLISIFDALWPKVLQILTDRENHRTTQRYEDSYVYKYFGFQFFSNCLYSSHSHSRSIQTILTPQTLLLLLLLLLLPPR